MGIARSEDRGGQDFYEIFARKKNHKWDLITNLVIWNVGKVSQR